MAIYAIADLHLSFSTNKPMDVFGEQWAGHDKKLKANWLRLVEGQDFVVIPGDISWAMSLDEAIEDFKFIDSLPGHKIISKGNHDYWWTSVSKLNKFIHEHGFSSISFLHNNSYAENGVAICGTRGWKCPESEEDLKIYNRELQRLEASLKNACNGSSITEKIAVFLHYPPFDSEGKPLDFVNIMKKYNVSTCCYGHLHGAGGRNIITGDINGIDFKFIAADYLNFTPERLFT